LIAALCAGVAAASSAITCAVVRPARPQHREPPPGARRVPFSLLVEDVREGFVDEIHVDDDELEYWYRSRDPQERAPRARIAMGLEPTYRWVERLRPTDPALPPPKWVFEGKCGASPGENGTLEGLVLAARGGLVDEVRIAGCKYTYRVRPPDGAQQP
jgi:hypothetical protein